MLILFHPMPEKRKRGVRRDGWQSQLLLCTLVLPYEVHDPNNLS